VAGGVRVGAGAVVGDKVGPYVSIGAGVSLAWGVSVGHGTFVGVDVSVGHGALVETGTSVAVGMSVGQGASVAVGVSVDHGVSVGVAVGVEVGVTPGVVVCVEVGIQVGAAVSEGLGEAVGTGTSVRVGVALDGEVSVGAVGALGMRVAVGRDVAVAGLAGDSGASDGVTTGAAGAMGTSVGVGVASAACIGVGTVVDVAFGAPRTVRTTGAAVEAVTLAGRLVGVADEGGDVLWRDPLTAPDSGHAGPATVSERWSRPACPVVMAMRVVPLAARAATLNATRIVTGRATVRGTATVMALVRGSILAVTVRARPWSCPRASTRRTWCAVQQPDR